MGGVQPHLDDAFGLHPIGAIVSRSVGLKIQYVEILTASLFLPANQPCMMPPAFTP